MDMHGEGAYLWPRSDAKQLFHLMFRIGLKDDILQWLTPPELIDFVLASGIMFTKEDMNKYTDVFRLVFADTIWLRKRLDEDYTFTLLSTDLKKFTSGYTSTTGHEDTSPKSRMRDVNMRAILIVTKNKEFIPCDDNFMPTRVFHDGKTQISSKAVPDKPKTRRIKLIAMRDSLGCSRTVDLLCPLVSNHTYTPLHAGSDMYACALAVTKPNAWISMCSPMARRPFAGRVVVVSSLGPEYVRATKDKCVIRSRLPNKYKERNTAKECFTNHFSIMSAFVINGEETDVLYCVPKLERAD